MKNVLKSTAGKCETCGSNLFFNPNTQSLDCNSCNTQQDIVTTKGLVKHPFDKLAKSSNQKNSNLNTDNHIMKCSSCGASVILAKFQTSGSCPYCNTNLIADKKQFSSLGIDSIIPFKFGKEKAITLFKDKLKSKWFISGKFLKSIKADEINAFYFPSFVFDSKCSSSYIGRLYDEDTREDSNGNRRTVRRYFNIYGKKETDHQNVIIEASTKLQQYELDFVKPYNFNEAQAYNDEFIYGYSLEQYSSSLTETYLQAEEKMKADIRKMILRSYSHDGVSYLNITSNFYNTKYSYCILPMYRINFSHKNKSYSNVMNGQTGTLGGKYPKSALKITLAVLIPILLFVVPLILAIIHFS